MSRKRKEPELPKPEQILTKVGKKKKVPTFRYIPFGAHPELGDLELAAIVALQNVARWREEHLNEDFDTCAMPEAIHSLLDLIDKSRLVRVIHHIVERHLKENEDGHE